MDMYLLQDGTHVESSAVSADKKGVLRAKNGLAVCLYEDGTPQTVAKDAVINKNVEAANAGKDPAKLLAEKKDADALLATTTNTATVAAKKPV